VLSRSYHTSAACVALRRIRFQVFDPASASDIVTTKGLERDFLTPGGGYSPSTVS